MMRIYGAFIGGMCIAMAAVLSNLVANPYLSPVVFTVGIMLCIQLQLPLITKDIPSGEHLATLPATYAANLIPALICGWLMSGRINPPSISAGFTGAVMTGIIIGAVAWANIPDAAYKIPITIILIWTFVFLGLPHCVVYGVWMGAGYCGIKDLLIVTAGNVVGGMLVRLLGTGVMIIHGVLNDTDDDEYTEELSNDD